MQVCPPSGKNVQDAEDIVTKHSIVKGQRTFKQAQERNKRVTLYATIGLTNHL